MNSFDNPYLPPAEAGADREANADKTPSLMMASLCYLGLLVGGSCSLIAMLFLAYMVSLPVMYPGFTDTTVPYSHWPWVNFLLASFFASFTGLLGFPMFLLSRRRLMIRSVATDH